MSTPSSAQPDIVYFDEIHGSPLYHKGIASSTPVEKRVNSKPKDPVLNSCFLLECHNSEKLRPILSKKISCDSKYEDWEGLKLLCTFYRINTVSDFRNTFICRKHWKDWYNFDYKLRSNLTPSETHVYSCSPQLSVVLNNKDFEYVLLGLGDAAESIFKFLDLASLVNLSRVSKCCNMKVKHFLTESIWSRFLLNDYYVDRNLTEMRSKESYIFIKQYLDKFPSKDTSNITIDSLVQSFKYFAQSSQLVIKNMLQNFGYDRDATPTEMLISFVAFILRDTLLENHAFLKHVRHKLSISDFRVGTEVKALPVLSLLFDIIHTGHSLLEPTLLKNRDILFRYLVLDSVRHKLIDNSVLKSLQRELSLNIV